MAYLAAERAKEKNWRLRAKRSLRIARILLGFSVSVALLPGLIVLGGNLTAADGIHIPVIRAASEPWRLQPNDPGGKVTEKIGYTVNRLLIGKQAADPAAEIVLAEPPAELYSEDVSIREYAAIQPITNLGWLSIDTGSGLDLRPAGWSASAAGADAPAGPGEQIDPMHVEPGWILVQVGAFQSRNAAENEWRKLRLSHGRLLRGRDWMIQRADTAAGDLYRLRFAGFADWQEATVYCGRLAARGTDCSPVVAQ